MQLKDIKELVKVLEKSNLNELSLVDGDFELHLQKNQNLETVTLPQQFAPAAPVAPAPAVAATTVDTKAEAPVKSNLLEVKSPMVGTFYAASSPDVADFVKIGDTINDDSVVCIVEAMKLFNEIKAEVSGKVVEVLVQNGEPVEYGQPMFLVEPV